MSKKKILTINCEIPDGLGEYVSLESETSLLDWDIILFVPDISNFTNYNTSSFQGKPWISESASFRLQQQSKHWSREIREALEEGKTIIVLLDAVKEVYIDTGERRYSGTGRNRHTTEILAPYDNYKFLPLDLKPVNSKGKVMKIAKNASLIAPYWTEFGEESQYRVRLEGKVSLPLLVTKTGDKTVGALIKGEQARGAMLLLPFIDLYNDQFYKENTDGDLVWTANGKKFGRRFLTALLELDHNLRSSASITPVPDWATDSSYEMPSENTLRQKILKIDGKVDALLLTKKKYSDQMVSKGVLRNLLYENGVPLENAIIEALKILGFSAENYNESDSEFDVIFSSVEGRLLGEAEGKDNKAIAIDKLRQLEMNIHEDLEREEVDQPAKGVLFGNAFRLSPIEDRAEFFTDKCLKSVKRSGTALIRTPDLFPLVQYLSSKKDAAFAKKCRRAILDTQGSIVKFPSPPNIL